MADQGGVHVDLTDRRVYIVMDLVYCCYWGNGAVREVEHCHGHAPSWEGRIQRKEST